MSQTFQLDRSLDQYISKLKNYGVIVNPKLQPALFALKNGLMYPGLLTTQQVKGSEQLVKMPIDLLLTCHRALKQPELNEVFSDRFYKQGTLWQDRVLVTYLLFQLSTQKQNIWSFMARHFSKEIDIISFWEEEEFESFVDQSVIKAAKKERQHFQKQWSRFEQIKQKYLILQDKKFFVKQQYKWIYIHTISRCFGSFLKSTYFVPYCQLFNHNCVDVSYACVNETETQITIEENKKEYDLMQQQDVESISSGYSDDYLSDDDFDYMSISSYSIKWGSKVSFDLIPKQTQHIQKSLKEVYNWIDKQLELRGFTLLLLGQIIQRLKIFQNQYMAGRQKYPTTIHKIEQTKMMLFGYRKYLVQLYRTQGKEYQKVRKERALPAEGNSTSWSHYQKSIEQCRQKYSHFKMEARDGAFFEKNSQIYFSYGKLSNRTLLVRYGFSLQDNHYDHFWIKLKMGKFIQPYPDLFEIIQNKGLSVNYKIKLKPYTMALQTIVYFRMLSWKVTHHSLQDLFFIVDIQREMNILQQVEQVYQSYLNLYEKINDNLKDKSIGYHEYFARVYNIQKKKILVKQIGWIRQAKIILEDIKNKKIIKNQDAYPNKRQMKYYLKGLKGLIKS